MLYDFMAVFVKVKKRYFYVRTIPRIKWTNFTVPIVGLFNSDTFYNFIMRLNEKKSTNLENTTFCQFLFVKKVFSKYILF